MAINPEQINAMFLASLSPNGDIRTQAEMGLKAIANQDGLLAVVLNIMASPNSDEAVKKSAAVFFKNRITQGWKPPENNTRKNPVVGAEDKLFVRNHIIQAVVELPSNISGIIRSALETILENDFSQWTGFIPDVMAKLQSNDLVTMHGALICLHSLLRAFRYHENYKPIVDVVITNFFAALQPLGMKLVAMDGPEMGSMLRLVLKIYLCAISREIPSQLQAAESLIPWGTLFVQIIHKNLNLEDILKIDPENRERHQWWKVKKWSFRCLHMLLSRCSKKANVKPEYANFSNIFIDNFAPKILTAVLGEVEKCIQGVWITRHVRQQMSIFIADCIKFNSTWTLLKPHVSVLIEQFVFPQLCFSEEHEERWNIDPVEYIQREFGDFSEEDKINPGAAAQYLLVKMVSNRFNHTVTGILTFVHGIMVGYNTSPEMTRNPRQKHGALKIITAISDHLMDEKKSPVYNQMEQFFIEHVFPEFKSPHGFLRAQAFEMLLHFEEMNFSELSQEIIFHGVLHAVQDPELPVKVYAAQTICLIVEYRSISEALKPHVATLMRLLLTLTREIDMDALTTGMETLAQCYPDELAPFALDLSQQMAESFMGIMSEIASLGEDEIEKKFNPLQAAAGILKTVATLIESVEKIPAVLAELETALLPIVNYVLQSEIAELYEEAMGIPGTLIYMTKNISPTMWHLWPVMYKVMRETEYFSVEDMFGTLDGFIQFGKAFLVQNPEIMSQIMDVIRIILNPSERIDEDDVTYGCLLGETLLVSTGHFSNQFIPELVNLSLQRLKNEADLKQILKLHLIELIINCMHLNPIVTLETLEATNATSTFFFMWFRDVNLLPRVHDIKLSILGLSALLTSPVRPFLQKHIGDLVNAMMEFFKKYPEAEMKRKQLIEKNESGEDEEEDEEEEACEDEVAGEDDDLSDEDDDFGDYEYGDMFNDELEEDPDFESLYDSVDPYIRFAELISQCPSDHPFRTSLNPQQQNFIETVLQTAHNRSKTVEAVA